MAYPTAEPSITKPRTAPVAAGVDYETLLAADPALQAAIARYGLGPTAENPNGVTGTDTVAAQGALSDARKAALIGYGAIPTDLPESMVGSIAPDITDSTRALAEQNTAAGLSTTAQLARAYRQRQGGDVASLLGRGLGRSGAYRQHSRENLQSYQVGQANALSGLLGTLGGLWQGYGQGAEDRASALGTATEAARGRITDRILAGDLGSTPPPAQTQPTGTSSTSGLAAALPHLGLGRRRWAIRAGQRMRSAY